VARNRGAAPMTTMLTRALVRAEKAEAEVERLRTCCTIEVMMANPNVNALITQHEGTILSLQARIRTLEEVILDAAEDEHAMNSGISSIGALLDEAKDIKARAALREGEPVRVEDVVAGVVDPRRLL